MFPLRDNIPTRTVPFVNYALIAANAAAFAYELSLRGKLQKFLLWYGLVPLKYASPGLLDQLGPELYFGPFLTSMFLHGGWLHILSNMWTLYIFGDNVEDRLGHSRYLAFYLLSGLAAGFTQVWASWGSHVPTIGASGAIAGVMGAYFILYPFARVVCLVPVFIFLQKVELPAFVFLLLWLLSQLYAGSLAIGGANIGGVAWWAHIGGFLGGVLMLGFFLRKGRGRAHGPRKA